MAKERKIICDCGGLIQKKLHSFENFQIEAMVCNKCGFTTLTKKQAQNYIKLKQLHKVVDAERKIIKIGNSMGITLPEELHDFGIKVGKKVKIEALSPTSFKVDIT